MEKNIWIAGEVIKILFDNKKGFMIFLLKSKEKIISVLGSFAYLPENANLSIFGHFEENKKYGQQFRAETYQLTIPENKEFWVKWLGSGIIKGVREKKAKRIFDYFGEETMQALAGPPERIAEVPMISKRQAELISRDFKKQTQQASTLATLCNYGINVNLGAKIIKKYKNPIEVLRKNPYQIADDIPSVGFKTIDPIAMRLGVQPESSFRIKSAIKFVLNKASESGDTCLTEKTLTHRTKELINVPSDLIRKEISLSDFAITVKGIGMIDMIDSERHLAKMIKNLTDAKLPSMSLKEKKRLDKMFILNEDQKLAVKTALENRLMILTGGPGTGKTFTESVILDFFKDRNKRIELAAPTGKAAKRMEQATQMPARTIHRLLGFGPDGSGNFIFSNNERNPLNTDVIIIDEVSMLDLKLAEALFCAIPQKCQVILIGDKDQLPSVGAGNVLADMLASNCCPVVSLTKIYRQAEGSYIAQASKEILQGKCPLPWKYHAKDFFFKTASKEKIEDLIAQLASKNLPEYTGGPVQILTPTKKNRVCCSQNLNQKLQEKINPPSENKNEYKNFREGDPIIHLKNNYQMKKYFPGKDEVIGVFNGDTGVIRKIDPENEQIIVKMDDDSVVYYDFEDVGQIDLAYAITIHKSQGSGATRSLLKR